MIKRDYMKEVENSLKLVREEVEEGIISKSKKKALITINKEIRGLVGLDIETIRTLSFDSVKDLIKRENEFNGEKYIALGELLRLNGNLLLRLGDGVEGIYYYNKALLSFYEAIEDDNTISTKYKPNIETMIDELNKYQLNLEESRTIFRMQEILGKYDKAEDILFSMIKISNKDKNIIKLGKEFYTRLESLSQEELFKGNLPIEEVKDSRLQLERY